MNKRNLLGIVSGIALLLPATASALDLPSLSNFNAGNVLRSSDLKALLQNVIDLKTLWANGTGSSGASPFVQSGNSLTANTDILRLKSNGPGLYFEELDQAPYRADYGHWRIIADQNALFIEDWERATPGESEYAQQDEFLSFHRYPTTNQGIANHVIQWQYDFLGSGVRNLNIGANWASPSPQTPRTLSLVALNGSNNSLVNALQIVPNNANPVVSLPNGALQVSGAITAGDALTTKGTGAGLHLYDRTNNAPSSWWYSSAPGVTSLYSDVSRKDLVTIMDSGGVQKLCIGSTCLTEAQLQALLKSIGQ